MLINILAWGALVVWFGGGGQVWTVEFRVDFIVVRGLWWNERKIPKDRIIAITSYPTIVYCSRSGRIRRKRIGFYARNRYADPAGEQRHRLQSQLEQAIPSSMRDFRRRAHHLDDQALADRLRFARTALRWAGDKRSAKLGGADVGALWAKHVIMLEAERSRRGAPA